MGETDGQTDGWRERQQIFQSDERLIAGWLLVGCWLLWRVLADSESVHAQVLAQTFLEAGFEVVDIKMHKRIVRNRKEQADMHRRWVQGTFVKSAQVVSL